MDELYCFNYLCINKFIYSYVWRNILYMLSKISMYVERAVLYFINSLVCQLILFLQILKTSLVQSRYLKLTPKCPVSHVTCHVSCKSWRHCLPTPVCHMSNIMCPIAIYLVCYTRENLKGKLFVSDIVGRGNATKNVFNFKCWQKYLH